MKKTQISQQFRRALEAEVKRLIEQEYLRYRPKLTGAQIQHLITRFGLTTSQDESGTYLRRKDGRMLKVATVEKMLGISGSTFTQEGKWVRIW